MREFFSLFYNRSNLQPRKKLFWWKSKSTNAPGDNNAVAIPEQCINIASLIREESQHSLSLVLHMTLIKNIMPKKWWCPSYHWRRSEQSWWTFQNLSKCTFYRLKRWRKLFPSAAQSNSQINKDKVSKDKTSHDQLYRVG